MSQLLLGQLVESTAGRDKGRFMIVTETMDSDYVYVADGRLRRVEHPKKKKIKHLKALNKRAKTIAEKLDNRKRISNEEIRRSLNELMDTADAEHQK